jgi:hypothetical protein
MCLFKTGGHPGEQRKLKKYDYKFETKTKNGGFLVLLNTLSVPTDWPLKNGKEV